MSTHSVCAAYAIPFWRFSQLEEDDNPWGFDSLLQAVTQESNMAKMMSGSRKEGSDQVCLPVLQISPIQSFRSTRSSRALVS